MAGSGILAGKRGLIMGVANDRSIAWGVAQSAAANGAELAFTYQGEAFRKRVLPLVEPIRPAAVIDCDVSSLASIDQAFRNWPPSGIGWIFWCTRLPSRTASSSRAAMSIRRPKISR